MSINQTIDAKNIGGSMAGLGNLLFREGHKWWGTRRWWMQLVLWLVVLNGFLVFGLFVMPGMVADANAEYNQTESSGAAVMTADEVQQEIPQMFWGIVTFVLPLGVIVLAQGQVYTEKNNGVAAWILSKPVGRSTYLLAKLLADAGGMVLTMVVLQLIPAYLLITSVIEFNATHFVIAAGLLVLLLFFYQAFTMMMSVIGHSTEVVLGASLGVFIGGMLLKDVLITVMGDFFFFTPWALPGTISLTILGQPLSQSMQISIVAELVWAVVCLSVMFWRFQRQDL